MSKYPHAKEKFEQLVNYGKHLEAAETFKCPECGTNVLETTKYCVKCQKKVGDSGADSSEEKEEKKEARQLTLKEKVACLIEHGRRLEAAETFKCPECGTNVLEKTKYCVKCQKKV
tara:strand:- start:187 stop:534 length:348 start_codon:yes stop_codon:yes gene_type:complete